MRCLKPFNRTMNEPSPRPGLRQHGKRPLYDCVTRRAAFALTLLVGLSTTAADADAVLPIRPDMNPATWEMLRFKGIPETAFRATPEGALEVLADKSASVLYLKIADEPVPAGRMQWEWQVVEGQTATDLTKTSGDDRILSIYVAFSDNSMTSRIKAMVSPLAAGNVLNYVWGGGQPLDIAHPYFPKTGRLIVKRMADAPTGVWLAETADLKADYERAFGTPSPGVLYIGVSGDADALGVTSKGLIRNIVLE